MMIHRSVLKLIDAASTDACRPHLHGVRIKKVGDKVEACATSGKLLAVIRHAIQPDDEFPGKLPPSDGEEVNGCTLPTTFVKKVSSLFKSAAKMIDRPILDFFRLKADKERGIEVEVVDHEFDATRLSGKAPEGGFPDYRWICTPPSNGTTVCLNPYLLTQAAKLICDLGVAAGVEKVVHTILLTIPPKDEKTGLVDMPIHLTCKTTDGTECIVMLMPLVQS